MMSLSLLAGRTVDSNQLASEEDKLHKVSTTYTKTSKISNSDFNKLKYFLIRNKFLDTMDLNNRAYL